MPWSHLENEVKISKFHLVLLHRNLHINHLDDDVGGFELALGILCAYIIDDGIVDESATFYQSYLP